MIIFNKRSPVQLHRPAATFRKIRGFTLVEIMISIAIFSIMMASMMPTFIVFTKGMASLGNYASMSMSSRNALEHFSRDVHMARTLSVASAYEITLELPSDAGSYVIHYQYDPNAGSFTRKQYAEDGVTLLRTSVLFSDVSELNMVFYNRLDVDVTDEASILTETKTIQLNAKLVKKVMNQNNTDYIISARFLMRNV